jgi:cytoskeletal protein RodZ
MGKAAQPSAQSSGRKDVSMQQAERIGAMLKRARESRGLTIEALSKELKLNPRYIQALEVDDYDLLPGDTYIRVYLRSVCVFLALNPDDILKRFFDERGLSGVDTLRKDSSTKIDLMTVREKERPTPVLYIVLVLIVMVATFAFYANSRGWFNIQPGNADADDQTQQTATVPDTAGETPALPPEIIKRTSKKTVDTPAIPAVNKNRIKNMLAKTTAALHTVKDTSRKGKEHIVTAAVRDTLSLKTATVKKTQDSLAKPTPNKPAADSSRPALSPSRQPAKDTALKAKPSLAKPVHSDTIKPAVKTLKDTAAQKPVPSPATTDTTKAVKQPVKDTSGAAKPKPDTSKAVKQPHSDSIKNTPVPVKPKKDSAKTAAPPIDSARKTVITTPVDPALTAATTPSPKTAMKLRITVQKDSCPIVVYRDGIRSRNMFHSGRSMYFIARDSFTVSTEANENTIVTLDGNPVFIPGTGAVSFKINASGTVTSVTEDSRNPISR